MPTPPLTNVAQLVDDSAARHPDDIAIDFNQLQLTYGELRARIDTLAASLGQLGIGRGDRVVLMLPNVPTYVMAFYALMRLGAVVVNVSPGSQGSELASILHDSGAIAVVSLDLFLPGLYKVLAQSAVKHLIITSVQGLEKKLPLPPSVAAPLLLEELLRPGAEAPSAPSGTGDDLAVLQYTSGSTGAPKGVMLTHQNLLASVAQTSAWMTEVHAQNGSVICVIPFFHVFGMTIILNLSMAKGYRLILLPRFDTLDLMPLITLLNKHQPLVSLPAVPTIWASLVSHPGVTAATLQGIRVPSSGGAPLPAWVQDKFYALTGRHIYEAYGLSEATGPTHCAPFPQGAPVGSVGRPLPGLRVRVVDTSTGERDLPVGEIGELAISGDTVMRGYFHNDALTQRVLRNGWFLTGDLARCDAEGFYYVVDRRDDLIITSGHKVYPSEVEAVLLTHPAVQDAVAVGVTDRMRGQFVAAQVVLKPGATATSTELLQLCRDNLSHYKVPRNLSFTDKVPRNPAGKTVRKDLVTPSSSG